MLGPLTARPLEFSKPTRLLVLRLFLAFPSSGRSGLSYRQTLSLNLTTSIKAKCQSICLSYSTSPGMATSMECFFGASLLWFSGRVQFGISTFITDGGIRPGIWHGRSSSAALTLYPSRSTLAFLWVGRCPTLAAVHCRERKYYRTLNPFIALMAVEAGRSAGVAELGGAWLANELIPDKLGPMVDSLKVVAGREVPVTLLKPPGSWRI